MTTDVPLCHRTIGPSDEPPRPCRGSVCALWRPLKDAARQDRGTCADNPHRPSWPDPIKEDPR